MQRELAAYLMQNLAGIAGFSRFGGLVQTLHTNERGTEAVAPVRYPITFDVFPLPFPYVAPTSYTEFVPNTAEAGIMYLEHVALTAAGYQGNRMELTSTLRLVCWLQQSHQDASRLGILATAQTNILRRLQPLSLIHNDGILTRLRVTPGKFITSDEGLFSRYTYREDIRQYLLDPYAAFGLDIISTFSVSLACLPEEVDAKMSFDESFN